MDGEVVQVSEANALWKIEDGPGDQYRYGLPLFRSACRLNRHMPHSIRHDSEDGYWSLDDRGEGTPVSLLVCRVSTLLIQDCRSSSDTVRI